MAKPKTLKRKRVIKSASRRHQTEKRVILLSGLTKKNTKRKTHKYQTVSQSGGSPPKLPSGPVVLSKFPPGQPPPVPSRAGKPVVKPLENPYNRLPPALPIAKPPEGAYMEMAKGVNPLLLQQQPGKFASAVSSVITQGKKPRTMSNAAAIMARRNLDAIKAARELAKSNEIRAAARAGRPVSTLSTVALLPVKPNTSQEPNFYGRIGSNPQPPIVASDA